MLTDAPIDWLIRAYTACDVADEQMSALAMTIGSEPPTPGAVVLGRIG